MLVDYAHTPDSLENVLRGGARADRGPADLRLRLRRRPRPRQAPADGRDRARELADLAIVTSDNPRSEDPEAIIAEILAGMPGAGDGEVEVEPDRRAAIALALGRGRGRATWS